LHLAELAAKIHATPIATLPSAIDRPPSWDAYIDHQIERFRVVEADHPESNPFMRYLASWLDVHRPPPVPLALIHGDFQPTNVVALTMTQIARFAAGEIGASAMAYAATAMSSIHQVWLDAVERSR